MRLGRGIVVAATAGVLATQAPGTATADGSPLDGYRAQQLTWGSCAFTQDPQVRPAECPLVTVPRGWAHPRAGSTLKIDISRVKATGHRTGMLLVNPGGPGAQGTPVAPQIATLEPAVNEAYDLIGTDPRGTGVAGSAEPDLQPHLCHVPADELPQRTDLDARDRSAANIAEHQKIPRAIAKSCQADPLAPYITTWQTAHDMELVRLLLGESTLNYLGYSYGTWLGRYGLTGDTCVENAVNAFLVNDIRAGSKVCPGQPLPGESRVYPTPGPVTERAVAEKRFSARPVGDLAVKRQEEISRMNSIR